MENMNWKTGSLIAILAIGGLFQVVKTIPVKSGSEWNFENIRFGSDATPYSIRSGQQAAKAKLPKAQPQARVAAMGGIDLKAEMAAFNKANQTVATNFEHGKPNSLKELKKDDFEIYIDPKTGKMMKRKKKKKNAKKKDGTKEEEIAAQDAVKEEPVKEEDDRSIEQVVANVAATGGFQNVAPKKDQPVAGSLEDWIRILLISPDATATKHFISQYQGGKVTSVIFYQVVQLMLEDSRTDMKQLGVMAAGVTPSVRSFEMLAEMQRIERPDSALAASINRFLEPYGTNLNYLGVLEKVLGADNGYSSILAVHKLNTAANRYLVSSATPPAEAGGSEVPSEVVLTTSPNAQYFTRFLALLENLTQSSNDQSMVEEAKSTLADLKTLLGTAPTQASAT